MKIIRSFKIREKEVFVVTGLFNQRQRQDLETLLLNAPYFRREVARPDTRYSKHFVTPLTIDEHASTFGYEKIRALLTRFFPKEILDLSRVYCNLLLPSDLTFCHADCFTEKKDVTVLFFANQKWEKDWGGEILFYDRGAAVEVVSPVPGTAVLFRGAIEHRATVFQRNQYEPRLTLALKFKAKKLNAGESRKNGSSTV